MLLQLKVQTNAQLIRTLQKKLIHISLLQAPMSITFKTDGSTDNYDPVGMNEVQYQHSISIRHPELKTYSNCAKQKPLK